MAVKIMLVAAGIVIGALGGAAFGVHAREDSDMGAGLDQVQTGVDGNDQGSDVSANVGPDLTAADQTPAPQQLPATWLRLAQCESSGRWGIVNPPYYGGLQFDLPSWRAAGGSGRPDQASPAEQVRVGMNWQRVRGWSAWPVCSRVIGVR